MPTDWARHVPGTARLPKNIRDPVDSIYNRAGRPHRRGISKEGRKDVSNLMREDRVQERLLRSRVAAYPAIIPAVESNQARIYAGAIPFDTAGAQPSLPERSCEIVVRHLNAGKEAGRVDCAGKVVRRREHLLAQPGRVYLQVAFLSTEEHPLHPYVALMRFSNSSRSSSDKSQA